MKNPWGNITTNRIISATKEDFGFDTHDSVEALQRIAHKDISDVATFLLYAYQVLPSEGQEKIYEPREDSVIGRITDSFEAPDSTAMDTGWRFENKPQPPGIWSY